MKKVGAKAVNFRGFPRPEIIFEFLREETQWYDVVGVSKGAAGDLCFCSWTGGALDHAKLTALNKTSDHRDLINVLIVPYKEVEFYISEWRRNHTSGDIKKNKDYYKGSYKIIEEREKTLNVEIPYWIVTNSSCTKHKTGTLRVWILKSHLTEDKGIPWWIIERSNYYKGGYCWGTAPGKIKCYREGIIDPFLDPFERSKLRAEYMETFLEKFRKTITEEIFNLIEESKSKIDKELKWNVSRIRESFNLASSGSTDVENRIDSLGHDEFYNFIGGKDLSDILNKFKRNFGLDGSVVKIKEDYKAYKESKCVRAMQAYYIPE